MNELIATPNGYVYYGKARAVFEIIRIMATTIPYHPDEIDWACLLAQVRN